MVKIEVAEMKPDRETWIQCLRSMTPQERLSIALKMTEDAKQQIRADLHRKFPHLNEEQFHKLYLKRIAQWQNED
jgi:hypothetical protein